MPTNVEIPALGESVTEAILGKWLKGDGDPVTIDEPICELETDKANVELPAPVAGVLRRITKAGETVRIGETIARIDAAGAQPTAGVAKAAPAKPAVPATSTSASVVQEKPAKPAAAKPAGGEDFSPAVRRLLEENHLTATSIPATGPGQRLTKEDVEAFLTKNKGGVSAPREDKPQSAPAAPMPNATGPLTFDADGVRRVPMSKIRKRIAERLVAAKSQAAMLTTFNEVDMTHVLDLRARYKARFTEMHGVSLGLMSFFARGVIMALREFPIVNAYIDGTDILYHEHVHLGIAVSTERGLVVPVLKNAETMSFARIETEIKRMATSARDGKLGLQELSGGTFTITNGGVFGSMLSTPILNTPQSGILGMHAIQRRPMAIGDKVEIRSMMYLALSYDHRLVDGKDSVSFLVRLKECLEDPARLMLEV